MLANLDFPVYTGYNSIRGWDMKTLTLVWFAAFVLAITACGNGVNTEQSASIPQSPVTAAAPTYPLRCEQDYTDDLSKPGILVLGDSISIGYWYYGLVSHGVMDNYSVLHNPCNAENSRFGVQNIDAWLAKRDGQWEMITFNHGIWDATNNGDHVGIEEYKSNLRIIGQKIQAKTAKPVFILTTSAPPEAIGLTDADIQTYNAAASEVMAELGIPVIDLYTYSKTINSEHEIQDGLPEVHYTLQGDQDLGVFLIAQFETLFGL